MPTLADRYWVGDTASWDGTAGTKWATSSGGAGGASIPDSTMIVAFDASSGSGTVTIATGNTGCLNVTFLGFTGTLTGTASIDIYGNYTLDSSMTYTYTGNINFKGNGSITTAGKDLGVVNINVDNGVTVNQNDALLSTATLNLSGVWNTVNFNLTLSSIYVNNTSANALSLGSSTVTLNNGTFYCGVSGTIGYGTSTVIIKQPIDPAIQVGTLDFYNLTIELNLETRVGPIIVHNNFVVTYSSTGYAGFIRFMVLYGNVTTSTFTITGTGANQIGVRSDTFGTQRTITAATVSITNGNFLDIIGAGAGSWTGTRVGDMGNNSGITFTTAATQTYIPSGGADNWSDATRWTSRVPLPQDNVLITGAFVGSLTTDCAVFCKDLNFTGSSGLTFFQSGQWVICGSITLNNANAISFGGAQIYVYGHRSGTITYTSAGNDMYSQFYVYCHNSTFQFADDSAFTFNTFGVSYGTIDFNNKALTFKYFAAQGQSGAPITVNLTSSFITILAQWNVSYYGSETLNAGTSTIYFSTTVNGTRSFELAGKTYYKVWFSAASGTTNIQNMASGTITNLVMDSSNTIVLQAGSTMNIVNASISGTAGNLNSIISSSSGTQATISKTSGIIVADYLSIKDSTTTGGASFYAGTHSTNVSGNSGWIFTGLPPTTATRLNTLTGINTLTI
jgi:hypothetical protein